jgi:hypothetical protein
MALRVPFLAASKAGSRFVGGVTGVITGALDEAVGRGPAATPCSAVDLE